jgi:hypothetical protein
MGRPVEEPQFGGAVGVGDDPGVEGGHDVVVGAVDDEQGTVAVAVGGVGGGQLAQLSCPAIHHP